MKKLIESLLVAIVGVFAGVYLLNPTAGLDFIPDIFPVIGNLDEVAATTLLLSALAYFGIDLKRLFGRRGEKAAETASANGVIEVEAEAVSTRGA
jgi:uncharacterized membrane protein YkvA (DUF1232 family)